MSADVLSLRALNRATLARQRLLERTDRSVADVVSHLVGMQSQIPNDPYVALWSRLEGFTPDQLADRLIDRSLVRIVLLRGTIHLVTADDALTIRPLAQSILDQEMRNHGEHKAAIASTDLVPVVATMRKVLSSGALNGPALRAAIAERFPDLDAAAMALVCRNCLALVQVPPRGVWGKSLGVTLQTLESWVGRELVEPPSVDEILLRLIGAFGPVTVADLATQTSLKGLREVVDRLRPQLRPFTNERGQELFDLPDAPRPDPDTPAPVRFLPTYDDLVLGDPERLCDVGIRKAMWHTGPVRGTVLHDGRVVAAWWPELDKKANTATLHVTHLPTLSKQARSAIESEAHKVAAFLEPGAVHDVRLST